MRQAVKIVTVILSLYTSVILGQDLSYQSTTFDNDHNDLIRLSLYGEQEAFLQRKQISFGSILKSHHFSDEPYNDTHGGFYFAVDGWAIGSYENSFYRDSVFFTYDTEIYDSRGLKFNFVTGLADGYAGSPLALDDYLPILGLSAKIKNLKAMLTYNAVAFGLEFPLN